ncbi:MAG: IS1595 family transposase [uncultured Sulfurovum sp.]|uniref:IS1595 family transposase n=1 Tax=uncultured Sulfurovum sp. TaxID=269237 RepID=A0A6S6SZN1_9BACT|nr:MAG: IS1595 family transposase [uncultured Sulfurovum sp.]
MKNKYIKISHISEVKFREIIKLLTEDLSDTQIANITKLNRNILNPYLMLFRERISDICEESSPLSGEIEVDESYLRS